MDWLLYAVIALCVAEVVLLAIFTLGPWSGSRSDLRAVRFTSAIAVSLLIVIATARVVGVAPDFLLGISVCLFLVVKGALLRYFLRRDGNDPIEPPPHSTH